MPNLHIVGRGLCGALIAAAAAMAQAAFAAPGYLEPFAGPMYLVQMEGTGEGDRVVEWRLVPEENRFDGQPGTRSTMLGGPYRMRWEVEEERNRLAEEGHPVTGVPVRIEDAAGRTVDGFLLGAKPQLVTPADRPLEDEVTADFRPGAIGPEYFSLPFSFDDFVEHYSRLKEEAALRGLEGGVPDLGTHAGRIRPVAPVSLTVPIVFTADCTAGMMALAGGNPGPFTAKPEPFRVTNSGPMLFTRTADGRVELRDPENPNLVIPGVSDGNGGFDAVLQHPQFVVLVAGVAVEDDASGKLVARGVARVVAGAESCSATWRSQ